MNAETEVRLLAKRADEQQSTGHKNRSEPKQNTIVEFIPTHLEPADRKFEPGSSADLELEASKLYSEPEKIEATSAEQEEELQKNGC